MPWVGMRRGGGRWWERGGEYAALCCALSFGGCTTGTLDSMYFSGRLTVVFCVLAVFPLSHLPTSRSPVSLLLLPLVRGHPCPAVPPQTKCETHHRAVHDQVRAGARARHAGAPNFHGRPGHGGARRRDGPADDCPQGACGLRVATRFASAAVCAVRNVPQWDGTEYSRRLCVSAAALPLTLLALFWSLPPFPGVFLCSAARFFFCVVGWMYRSCGRRRFPSPFDATSQTGALRTGTAVS